MPNTFDDIETLIARAMEDSLSKEEAATLQAWLEEDGANRRYYEEIKKTWDITGAADTDFVPDTERNWQRFQQKIQTPVIPIRKSKLNVLRIAATLLLVAGAGTLYLLLQSPGEITVQTAAMEKKEVTLPDGSKVFMNQHSSLRYAKNLAGAERAVYLEGEAFFDVAHEEARPFVVYANQTQTQVLGTTFDIKAYDKQPVEVAVLTGKVAVSRKTTDKSASRLVLTSGRKAIFKTQLEEIAISDPNLMAWKENVLRFDDVPLHDVIRTLKSYYDVPVVIEDSEVARLQLRSNFYDAPKLEQVLDVIAASADITWVKEQGVYKLKKKN